MRHGPAASSGSDPKDPRLCRGYLLQYFDASSRRALSYRCAIRSRQARLRIATRLETRACFLLRLTFRSLASRYER